MSFRLPLPRPRTGSAPKPPLGAPKAGPAGKPKLGKAQRGRLLSGGQRQRIAIGRAILRDAPVLVLDEPTAGLSQTDTRTVMRLLRPVMAGRTTIVITHDTSVAALADRIVTTEGGADYLAAPASPAGAQLTGVTFPV